LGGYPEIGGMRMRARNVAIWAAVAVTLGVVAAALIVKARRAGVTLTGVVLRQDIDPRKQLPISNVKITATDGARSAEGESDISGLFRLRLPDGGWRERQATVTFRCSGYQPLEITPSLNGEIYVIRLTPIAPLVPQTPAPEIIVKDVRVRYAERTTTVVDVGSTAKTFTVANTGDVPCERKIPCSPDGQWKASLGGLTMDSGEGQQFENARVSCIAGPCPFTRIESGATLHPGRKITVSILDWSDTATFLVEAEVTRSMPSDAIRQAYPAIYGRAMSFTLPATAEGPSVETNLGGAEIVFPLGPELLLSWADCSLQVGADQTKLYRCELKPGYEFQ
jgi:hypothetical protein